MGVVTTFIPKFIINYLSISLFAFFGTKMIYESIIEKIKAIIINIVSYSMLFSHLRLYDSE